MGFKDILTIRKNVYDDFGNPVSTDSKSMKCLITEQNIKNSVSKDEFFIRKYDLKALVKHKSFEPYSIILTDKSITVVHSNLEYRIKSIGVIRKNGKPLYYELAMDLQ